jgi:bacteriorhodopsin
VIHTLAPPWEATLSNSQHSLILYFLGVATLALLAGFVRAYVTRGEIGARYRGVTVARLGVMGIAGLAYVLLVVMFLIGYDYSGGAWVPNALAENSLAPRYMEWSLTVPLLCAELLAVCTLAGPIARRFQWLAMGSAFVMIFTGFLGADVFADSDNSTVTLIWFEVATLFWVFTNVILIRAFLASLPGLTPEAGALLRRSVVLLLGGWIVYPAVSLIQVFAFGGEWTTTIQIALCVADIVVKVWFGALIHRVAQLRTAEDVRAGLDVHPEAIWISSVKQSDAGAPAVIFLDPDATIHAVRDRPAVATARGASRADALEAAEAGSLPEV